MRARLPLVWLLGCLSLTQGCSECSASGGTVPFGLEAGPAGEPPDPDEREPERGPEPIRAAGRAFDDGTRRVDLEGAPIALEHSIRVLWAHDVDGDGDRDAVLLTAGPDDAPVRVVYAQRDGAAFAEPRVLARAPAAPVGCVIERASMEPLGARWLVGRATLTCEDAPAANREELFVLETGQRPRLLESLGVLSAEDRAPGAVTVELAATEAEEGDGEDLLLSFTLDAARIDLPWRSGTSGLARDPSEPETTLNQRSREALRALGSDAPAARARSEGVLRLHQALCRESGRHRLRVGRSGGVTCGRSSAAGRAATTILRAHAAEGSLLEALTAMEGLDAPGLDITAERREFANAAIAEAPGSAPVTLREGPEHAAPSGVLARLSSLAFLDEDRVLLRGPTPRVWDLASGQTEVSEESGESRILDPGARFAVARLMRTCEGTAISIVAELQYTAALTGSPHAAPLLAGRPAPDGATCERIPPALEADSDGWQLLGWAPQGVVAARGSTLRVVPMTESGRAAGDPEELPAATLPPAPLAPGFASADGRFHVERRGLGVLVHRVAPDPETVVLWPEGWASRDGAPTDLAVSPSGRRVAVLRGRRVLLLERPTP